MKKTTLLMLLVLFIKIAIGQNMTYTFTVKNNLSPQTVVSGASVTISPAWASPQTVISDANGLAVFSIPKPAASTSFPLTATAAGYQNFIMGTGAYYVGPNDVTKTSTLTLKKLVDVAFKVTDAGAVAIAGATISITTPTVATLTTDAGGNATISGTSYVYAASVGYTVTANGYESKTISTTISGTALYPFTIPITLAKAYSITFWVTNGVTGIEGANVTIGTTTVTTDAGGYAVFTKRVNGSYAYVVSKTGIKDKYGSVTVADLDMNQTVITDPGFDLVFTLINGASPSTTGLQQDTITIDGVTKITTSTNNILKFGVAPGSSYSFINKKAGFIDVPVSVSNIQANTAMTLYMVPNYSVKFTVSDGSTAAKIAGAKVAFNGQEVITGSTGIAQFYNVPPSATNYPYTITGPDGAGYFVTTGTETRAKLVSTSYLSGANNNLTKSNEYLNKPYAYIGLASGMMTYLSPATINFDGVDYAYQGSLGGIRWDVPPGTYPYIVTPDDVTKAILRGTITVPANAPGQLQLQVVAGQKIEMYVTDASPAQNPLQGASITLNGETKTTDANGYALYSRKAINTNYTYTVTKLGYTDASGTANLVTADLIKVTTLTAIPYTVTFVVSNGGVGLAGASVKMGDVTVVSDVNGMAAFANTTYGPYAYTVTKAGYITKTGSVVVDASKSVPVAIELGTYNLTMNITSGGTALAGATVTVAGAALISDANGKAVFPKTIGTYAYTVKKAGYNDAAGNVTVTGGDLTQNVAMVLTPYKLTFTVKSGTNPLAGAKIVVGVDTLTSDATGKAVFNRTMGTFAYTVYKPGYYTVDASTTVGTADKDENVSLVAKLYIANFTVMSGTSNVAGATVTCNATTATTDANGFAQFTGLTPGVYPYTVSKTGYGTATGTITVVDGDITKTVNILSTVGIDPASAKTVKMYPNPTSGNLFVNLTGNNGNAVIISITNMIGSVLQVKKIDNPSNQVRFDLSGLGKGVYFIRVSGNGFENTTKVVKN